MPVYTIKRSRVEGCSIQRQSAKSQRDVEVGRNLALVKHCQKIRQTKKRNVMQSPQLETKGRQNKRIEQQNGKQSPQLRAKAFKEYSKMLNSFRIWSLCSQRQKAIRLRKCENKVICSNDSLGTYRMNISRIITKTNRNCLIVHAKTELLLLHKLCSIHSLRTPRMNISQMITKINRNWWIVYATTTLLLLHKLCNIHSLRTYRMNISRIKANINRSWLILHT